MKLVEAFSLFFKIIDFCVKSFEEMLSYCDGAGYYIAAISIFMLFRFLLVPLFRPGLGSDIADENANRRKKGG